MEEREFILDHTLPTIGRIQITLKGMPRVVYSLMEKNNEIDRLQRLLHVGVLSKVFPGMRHTRWDYTMASLHFVNCMSESRAQGLSRNMRVAGNALSGRDILQILLLIANIGHLPGTFDTEKGIVRVVHKLGLGPKLLREAGIGNSSVITLDYRSFNKILILLKLKKWEESELDDYERASLRVCQSLVKDWILKTPSQECRRRILDYWWLARSLAYQLLDCLYVELPVIFNYKELACIAGRKEDFGYLLDQYTRIVYKTIYHSMRARQLAAAWVWAVEETLHGDDSPLSTIQKWLDKASLEDIVPAPCSAELVSLIYSPGPHGIVRDLLTESFVNKGVETLETSLTDFCGGKVIPLFSYVPWLRSSFADEKVPSEFSFQLFAKPDATSKDRIFLCGNVLRWLQKSIRYTNTWGLGALIWACIESVLKLASYSNRVEVRPRLRAEQFFANKDMRLSLSLYDQIAVYSAEEKERALTLFLRKERGEWTRSDRDKFHELKMLRLLITRRWERPKRGIWRLHVIIPCEIEFLEDGKSICAFDGGLVFCEGRGKNVKKMGVFLLEAKRGKKTPRRKAQDALRTKMRKLGGEYSKGKIKSLKKKNAYLEIHIS